MTAKTPSEIIKDFKVSFLIFFSLYVLFSAGFAVTVWLGKDTLDLPLAILLFFSFILVFSLWILPKVYNMARLLNEKGVMDIAPALLVALQFILNMTITSAIIPVFLWAKCSRMQKRRLEKLQNS
ncbi:MAG: hypothetical protein Q7T18_12030 [Sedimentisphaerales bacterium]|nr:hypothetical protein [Sedimentisphaerales bacterium]